MNKRMLDESLRPTRVSAASLKYVLDQLDPEKTKWPDVTHAIRRPRETVSCARCMRPFSRPKAGKGHGSGRAWQFCIGCLKINRPRADRGETDD